MFQHNAGTGEPKTVALPKVIRGAITQMGE